MFQRLKGALDARIAEEQARQQAAQFPSTAAPRSDSRSRRLNSRADSPAKRTTRPTPQNGKDVESDKGPDPGSFEPEFVIADDDSVSRSSTPLPLDQRSGRPAADSSSREDYPDHDRDAPKAYDEAVGKVSSLEELPTEVRVKLRRLDKLESRYHELLRSYRVAHARVQSIEPFEAALRECTPLTSINDPNGLSEYLNNINLKGDLVLDELKRVSGERDHLKDKVAEAEANARTAWDEVSNFKRGSELSESHDISGHNDQERLLSVEPKQGMSVESHDTVPIASDKHLQVVSPIKPNSKGEPQSLPGREGDDFFSFDEEIPRLQSVLLDRQNVIHNLELEVKTLRGDLAVTRESTQSMVESLEEATRELNVLRDGKARSEEETPRYNLDHARTDTSREGEPETTAGTVVDNSLTDHGGEAADVDDLAQRLRHTQDRLEELQQDVVAGNEALSRVKDLQNSLARSEDTIRSTEQQRTYAMKRAETLDSLLNQVRMQLQRAEDQAREFQTALENISTHEKETEDATNAVTSPVAQVQDHASANKRKSKKKKKGMSNQAAQNKLGGDAGILEDPITPSLVESVQLTTLHKEVEELRETLVMRQTIIETMKTRLKDQDDLREEIETLRDDLINVGQEHVSAKDKVKDLDMENTKLRVHCNNLEEEISELRSSRSSESETEAYLQDLQAKTITLESDLSAAQQLASTRFRDMSELKTILQKAQPEITLLRTEASKVKDLQGTVERKDHEITGLEGVQATLRAELTRIKQLLATRDCEIMSINLQLDEEGSSRQQAEALRAQGDLEKEQLKQEKIQTSDLVKEKSKELAVLQKSLTSARSRLEEIEHQSSQYSRDKEILKEELELKSAQYASAQSLMGSMRDQTNELAMQMKEARDRCENLEEEIGDAHRLLSERSREAETMRRLLAEVESRADTRIREMKDRMETAIEERDHAEDQASTTGRRKARELEELRNHARETAKNLKRTEEGKEELELAQREWKRRREDLENQAERFSTESKEVRQSMSNLQDVLDNSERQARELEKQKSDLSQTVEEIQLRMEKLQKSNKSMIEELQTLRSLKSRRIDTPTTSSRSSIDLGPAKSSTVSPQPTGRPGSRASTETINGKQAGSTDVVYLKNVLLQFLEQKDKKHQMQLVPVLGMLLHFDRTEEQQWMTAITAK